MDIVVESDLIIILFCCLAGHTLILWEHQVVSLAWIFRIVFLDEIILSVALCTYQRAHLLVRSLTYILSCTLPCLIQCRTGRAQVHRTCIMTVAATNGVHDLTS